MAADRKYDVGQFEDVEVNGGRRSSPLAVDKHQYAKHGDRALAIIGDERVKVTEEDVGLAFCSSPNTVEDVIHLDLSRDRTNAFEERPTRLFSPF